MDKRSALYLSRRNNAKFKVSRRDKEKKSLTGVVNDESA